MKSRLIDALIISGAVFLSSLFIALWGQGAIQQIAGLAVAQTSTTWNNLKDAAVGDNLSTGIGALGCYEFDGTNWDRCRGDTTNGIDVDVTRLQGGTTTPADAFSNPTTAITNFSLSAGFNGTTWDRLRSSATNADALATQTLGALQTNSIGRGWNGTNFDRLRSGSSAADGIATTTTGNANSLAYRLGWNGTTWDRQRSGSTAADGIATTTTGNANSLAYLLGWNGTTWDRIFSENNNANHVTRTTGNLATTSHNYEWDTSQGIWTRGASNWQQKTTGITTNAAGTALNMTDTPMSKFTMIIDRTAGTTDAVAINLECSQDGTIWPGTTQSLIQVTTLAVEPTRNAIGDAPCVFIRYNVVTIGAGNTVTIALIAER